MLDDDPGRGRIRRRRDGRSQPHGGLSSCYLADLKGRTAVSHLRRAPASPPVFSQRVVTGMAGATLARACLLDHAAELRAMLDPEGEEAVSVEVSDAALARAAAVWREPER